MKDKHVPKNIFRVGACLQNENNLISSVQKSEAQEKQREDLGYNKNLKNGKIMSL